MEDNTQTPAQQGGTQPATGTTQTSVPTPVEEREYRHDHGGHPRQ